jgi:hypothetical protein
MVSAMEPTSELAKIAPKKKRKTHTSSRAGKGGWKRVFIGALAKIPNITYACRTAHVTTPTAYARREKDPQFRADWEVALNAGIERLEQASYERATEGVPRGVWMKTKSGRIKRVETVREYSDTLAIFLLKAHKPDKYRETLRQEIGGLDGAPIVLQQAAPVVIVWPHETAAVGGNGNGNGQQKAIQDVEAEPADAGSPGEGGPAEAAPGPG